MPRSYRSPTREAAAAVTRARIVTSAGALFSERGYVATSMQAIAEAAGVSVPTVHVHGPKHALLVAAFELSFAGDEGSHSITERPRLADIMREPAFEDALERYLAFLADANERSAGLIHAMRAAADVDEGAATVYREMERRRDRDLRIAAEWFAGRGRIATTQVDTAADILRQTLSPDAFLKLTRDCGWSIERYVRWVGHQLRTLDEHVRAVDGPPESGASDH